MAYALAPIVEVSADSSEASAVANQFHLRGNVNIMYMDASLSADHVLWDDAALIASASGSVVLWVSGQRIHGTYAEFDFQAMEGFLENAEIEGDGYFGHGARVDIETRPADAKREEKKFLVIRGGQVTTCDLLKPHYHAAASTIKVIPQERVHAYNMTLKAGAVPFAYFPYFRRSLRDRWHAYIFDGGYSSRKGAQFLNKYVLHFNDQFREAAYFDYMTNYGYGFGWKHAFRVPEEMWDGEGRIFGYYFEQDYDDNDSRDRNPNDGGRWALEGRTRHDFTERLRLTGEFLNFSDDNFDNDFEEELLSRGVERDSLRNRRNPYVNLAWTQPDFNLRGIYKERMDDFADFHLTDDERKPQLRWDVKRLALFDGPVYAKYHADFVRLRQEDLIGNSDTTYSGSIEKTDRYDTGVEFSAPFTLFDWLRVNPFAGYEFTYYGDPEYRRIASSHLTDPNTRDVRETEYENVSRHLLHYGADLNTRRMVDLGEGFLGPRYSQMRLLLEPTISYQDYFPNRAIRDVDYRTDDFIGPPDFLAIDEVDSIIDHARILSARLDTRLQAKQPGQQLGSTTLIRHAIEVGYDFREDDDEEWRNLRSELFLTLFQPWTLYNTVNYDLNDSEVNSTVTGMSVRPFQRLSLDAGYTTYRQGTGTDDSLYWALRYRASPKWMVNYEQDYDLDDDITRNIRVGLTRDLHDWDASFIVRYKNHEDDENETQVLFRMTFKPDPSRRAREADSRYTKLLDGANLPLQ